MLNSEYNATVGSTNGTNTNYNGATPKLRLALMN